MAIKKLNKRHLEIARLLSEFKTQREIAQTLNLSESHVSRVVHSDVFRQYREGQRKERIEQISEEIKRRYWGPYMQSHAALQTPDGSVAQKMRAAEMLLGAARYGIFYCDFMQTDYQSQPSVLPETLSAGLWHMRLMRS
ncbi:MAG: hypothetical protein NTY29_10295 [Proteobacteria bacterium]|nr:hypothetical protein [Pseudomonadota bacterium]